MTVALVLGHVPIFHRRSLHQGEGQLGFPAQLTEK